MTTHANGLAQPSAQGVLYLEIEGIPYAFGTESEEPEAPATEAAWFDVAGKTFKGIKPWLKIGRDGSGLPVVSSERLDIANGRVSINSLRLGIVDAGTALSGTDTLAGYVAPWRMDGLCALSYGTATTTIVGADDTVIDVVDASVAVVGGSVLVGGVRGRVVAIDTGANTITLAEPLTGGNPGAAASVVPYELSASATADEVTGSTHVRTGGLATAFASSGTIWMGNECCTYTRSGSTFTLVRGKYRSRIEPHRSWTRPDGTTQEAPVLSSYPRGLTGRRCWLRWGLDAASDADCVTVYAGEIASTTWADAGRTLMVEIESAQRWLDKPIFSNLWDRFSGNGKPIELLAGVNTRTTVPIVSLAPTPEHALLEFVDGEDFACLVGDVPYILRRDASLETDGNAGCNVFVIDARLGRRGPNPTEDGLHSMRPIVFASASDTIGGPTYAGNGRIVYSHPLEIMLAIMTSTGAGGNGTYDDLPREWGLAIDESDIDTTGIAEIIARTRDYLVTPIILDPVPNAREWMIETLLKPFGFYLRTRHDSTLAIGELRALGPSDTAGATSIALADLAQERSQFVTLEGPTLAGSAMIGAIEYETDPVVADGKIEWLRSGVSSLINAEFIDAYQSAPTLKVRFWGASSAPVETDGIPVSGDSTPWESQLSDLASNLFARYQLPPAELRVACSIRKIGINVGDPVSVTLANVPNPRSNTRGLSAEIFEVLARDVDLSRGIVTFTLAMTAATYAATRNLALALAVASWVDGTKTATVTQNAYTDSAGSYDDTSAFEVGDAVRVYSADFASRSSATTIASKTATTVVLAHDAAGLGVTPASGYHIMHDDVTGVSAGVRSEYAFRAGNDGLLGASDAPHVFA